tara:strand:- start:1407 stop:2036 length:630 start_codon:yes stop_codon:yes gene_type:complete
MKPIAGLPLRNHFIPAERRDSALLIVMHGLGDRMESFFDFPSLLLGNRLSYLFLNAPDAYVVGWKWYDLDGQQETGLKKSRELLDATIDHLHKEEDIAPDQIVLSGFSQGAVVSLYTGIRRTRPLAGIGALSGYLFGGVEEASDASKNTPIFMTHGLYDEVLPYERSEQHGELLSEAGYKLDWREYPMGHQICQEEMQDFSQWLSAIVS